MGFRYRIKTPYRAGVRALSGINWGALLIEHDALRSIDRIQEDVMRYTEAKMQPVKAVKEPKKEIPVKAGQAGYDYMSLAGGKKIPTKGGFK